MRPEAMIEFGATRYSIAENDTSGERIDYEALVSGGLHLVPRGAGHEVFDESVPLGVLMECCAAIEARANAPWLRDK